jgi:Formyl transferase
MVDHCAYDGDRESFERAMQEVLDQHGIDLVCLAGFMRLLSPWFVARWKQRMLNIHPALLPAFKGLDTHRRALSAGVKIHGASVHFVSAQMDCGPIVIQGALAVREDDDEEARASHLSDGARAGGSGPRASGERPLRYRRRGQPARALDRPWDCGSQMTDVRCRTRICAFLPPNHLIPRSYSCPLRVKPPAHGRGLREELAGRRTGLPVTSGHLEVLR